MVLGVPLLSISKNADEWLAYSNDNVTLLLSFTKNVFNGIRNHHSIAAVYESLALATTVLKLCK